MIVLIISMRRQIPYSFCVIIGNNIAGSPQQSSYSASMVINDNGSLVYDITRQQLELFLSCGFTVTRIAQLVQVSRKTIQRRLRYNNSVIIYRHQLINFSTEYIVF